MPETEEATHSDMSRPSSKGGYSELWSIIAIAATTSQVISDVIHNIEELPLINIPHWSVYWCSDPASQYPPPLSLSVIYTFCPVPVPRNSDRAAVSEMPGM